MASASPSGKSGVSGTPHLLQLVFVGVVLLLVFPTPTPATPIDLTSVISLLADNVIDRLFSEGQMTLLGHRCTYKKQPRIYSWQLQYQAEVFCPGWTSLNGKSGRYLSSNTALREATKNLMKQAVDKGLVTKEEAGEWL
ncbi:anti-lipopolysaccharide factor-like [Homarus americanus]|uniref:anti-lipopolysaccharide factor-like n=1 Tax=Homarus americanus TaxID=6706 RepID=UPI001C445E85|nr:anti-lipopolysaccharide factor-like [Homarus americanus]